VSLDATLPAAAPPRPAPLPDAPPPTARPPARPGALGRLRAIPLTAYAFLVSRLLVLVSGAVGWELLTRHAQAGTIRQARALGAVGSALAASADRFDAGYYLNLATVGYDKAHPGWVAFYPAYPELIRIVAVLTRSPVLAGGLVSLTSFAVALVLLHRLTERELGRPAAEATSLLLCFAPLSFFFSAVYTESLFLALTVATFYAARTDRWRLACALAAAATLTRPTGILLVAVLCITWRRSRAPRRELVLAGLAPAALLGWMVTLSALGFGMTSLFRVQRTQWHRVTVTPLEGLAAALASMARGLAALLRGGTIYHPAIIGPFTPHAQDVLLGGILILCLVLLEVCRRTLRAEYTVYAALVILVCLSSPEQGEPLWSFDRFALTIFPLWMVAGALLARHRRLLAPVLVLCAAGLVFYTMQFSSWAFIA
jgi:hypothetical protein